MPYGVLLALGSANSVITGGPGVGVGTVRVGLAGAVGACAVVLPEEGPAHPASNSQPTSSNNKDMCLRIKSLPQRRWPTERQNVSHL